MTVGTVARAIVHVVVDSVGEFLVNVFVVKVAWPTKDNPKVVVKNVGRPESAQSALDINVVDGAPSAAFGDAAVETKSRNELQGRAKHKPATVEA